MRKEEQSSGISVIVPFLNESDCIDLFCSKIDEYAGKQSFLLELIFVDDGSVDDTIEKIKKYQWSGIENVKIIQLSKNYGSHAAIRAGLKYAFYDICTWMGSDGQDPLNLLDESWVKLTKEGYDAVYIDKKSVEVGHFNRLFSKIYSHLMKKYAVSSYSSGGTATIVFNKKIKDVLNDNVESNSSIMLQIMNTGFKYCTLSMNYGERTAGMSKWTLKKKIKLFIDSFVAFSFMPIRMVSIVGVIMFLLGILTGVYSVICKLTIPGAPTGYTTLICVMALGFGITNIALGIIAEYLWRTYDASRNRPVYIVSEEIQVK